MLSGESLNKIDTKGRITIPTKFREALGEKIVITKGLDGCLFIFDLDKWRELEQRMNELPLTASRNIKRFLIGSKEEIEIDKQGRGLIPANLREYARLEKDVVIVGLGTRAEIWSKNDWDIVNDDFVSEPDEVANQMEQLGI